MKAPNSHKIIRKINQIIIKRYGYGPPHTHVTNKNIITLLLYRVKIDKTKNFCYNINRWIKFSKKQKIKEK